MFIATKMFCLKSSCSEASKWVVGLCLSAISHSAFAQADGIEPDLFFSLDAKAIEDSGISRWLEKKYPDLREWSDAWSEDFKDGDEVYQSMGLRDEDFSKIEFAFGGLESLLNNSPLVPRFGSEVFFGLGMRAGKPMNLEAFFDWIEKKVIEEFGPIYSKKVLINSKIEDDRLEFLLNFTDSNHSRINTPNLIFDANVSVSAEIDDNSSRLIFAMPKSFGNGFLSEKFSYEFSTIPQMPEDRQITFVCKIPSSSLDRYILRNGGSDDSLVLALQGTREIAWSASFREDSLFLKTIISCVDADTASSVFSLYQGTIGMAQLIMSQDPSSRPILSILRQLKTKNVGKQVIGSVELNASSLEMLISQALSDLAPVPPPAFPKLDFQSLEGSLAPSFTLPLSTGKTFDLSSQLGKAVVLDFWATWCGPCRRGLPMIMEAVSDFPSSDVVFVAVNQGESKEQVDDFLNHYDLRKLSVALDSNKSVGASYGVKGLPHTVVIDPSGIVRDVTVGFSPFQGTDLKRRLEKLLK